MDKSQEKPIRVQIVQPLIPEYRVPLFRRLAAHKDLHVKVCASRTVPGIDNLSSVETDEEYADLEHPCIGFLGNRLLWQHKLKLAPDMGKGDVLVVGNIRLLNNIPLILKAKTKHISIVWWGHGLSKRRNRFKDVMNLIIVYFTDTRLLYNDKELEEYRKLGLGFPKKKLYAINNAIDQGPIKEAIHAWGKERLKKFQEREYITGEKILLFCGRRTNTVAMEDVFNALAHLRNTNDNCLFAIIGPDDSDGILGEKARELGVADCIRWLGPIFDQNELAPWFLSASCFVFPGAIGLSLIHAFFYGLPVVVPDCPHGPEIAALNDGENGLFYSEGNVESLTKKIKAIINCSEYQQKMSENALKAVENNYNMDDMANRYVTAVKAASQKSR